MTTKTPAAGGYPGAFFFGGYHEHHGHETDEETHSGTQSQVTHGQVENHRSGDHQSAGKQQADQVGGGFGFFGIGNLDLLGGRQQSVKDHIHGEGNDHGEGSDAEGIVVTFGEHFEVLVGKGTQVSHCSSRHLVGQLLEFGHILKGTIFKSVAHGRQTAVVFKALGMEEPVADPVSHEGSKKAPMLIPI